MKTFSPVDILICTRMRDRFGQGICQGKQPGSKNVEKASITLQCRRGTTRRVQLKLTDIPHREPQALVTTIRQAAGFAAISRWLSASDTSGLWNNNDMHPGGVPPVISIEHFSINASAATPPGCVPFLLMHTGGGATSLHPRLMACKPSA